MAVIDVIESSDNVGSIDDVLAGHTRFPMKLMSGLCASTRIDGRMS